MIDEISTNSRRPAFLFLLALALLPGSLPAEPPDAAAVCRGVIAELTRGDFAAVAARFDDPMKQALSAEKLGEGWKGMQGQTGPLVSCGEPQVRGASASATCRFQKASLALEVAVAPDGRVSGLFFRPAAAPEGAWTAPAYVKANAFQETAVTVGKDEWPLPGTLAMPAGDGPFPALVLVHGSGPQDRDESIGGSKPFRDLAQGLASRGIAVLRYDKRTLVHAAKLVALKDPTLKEETVDDAVAAAVLLRATPKIDGRRVFVLGHSLGGTAAGRIAKADASLAGVVLLAGGARPLWDVVVEQLDYLVSLKAADASQVEAMRRDAAKVKALEAGSKEMLLGAPASYWLDLRAHDPVATLRAAARPVLVLQGERDYQVTQKDLELWRRGLEGRPGVTIKTYPKLNHLFVEGEGKSVPKEYERPGHVAAEVVADIAGWIERTRP